MGGRRAVSRESVARRRQKHTRHAWASLLWGVVALVLIQASFGVMIRGPAPQWRDPAFEIKASRLQRLLDGFEEPPFLIVMTGSSVTCNAFHARYIEANLLVPSHRRIVAYNMGNLGAGPLTQLIYTRRLLERGIRPDHLLIELSPQLYKPGQPVDLERFPLSHLSERDREVIEHYNPDSEIRQHLWQTALFPAYAHRLGILNNEARFLVPRQDRVPIWDSGIDDRGWTELTPVNPERARTQRSYVVRAHEVEVGDLEPGEASIHALRQLLELIERERIRATVILAPQGPAFRQLYGRKSLDSFLAKVTDLCREHGVTYHSAFDWLEEEMFNDSIHANSRGAEVFSQRLVAEVLSDRTRSTGR